MGEDLIGEVELERSQFAIFWAGERELVMSWRVWIDLFVPRWTWFLSDSRG